MGSGWWTRFEWIEAGEAQVEWVRPVAGLEICAGGFGIRLDWAQSSGLYIGKRASESGELVRKGYEKDKVGSVAVGKWA